MNNGLEFKPKLLLCLCMIVKNEEQNLPRCLSSVKPYVDKIVVVDTGSQDDTTEIAIQYGANVEKFEWCDDFAAARNYAISHADCDWILMMDADEELVINSEDFLAQLISHPEFIAYSLTLSDSSNEKGMTPLHTIRLFRNIPELQYVGRYHEQLKYQNQPISNNLIKDLKSIRILHYGYEKEQLQQKTLGRNIPLLERIRQQQGLSLMLLYCLAGMYTTTQQTEKAQECHVEAFERLLPNLLAGNIPEEFGFVPSLLYSLGAQSLQQKDHETAQLICQRGLEWCSQYPPLNYLAGFILKDLGFTLGAVAYFENCIQMGREVSYYKGEPFEQSFITTVPACALGTMYIHMERWQEAVTAFELALSFDENCIVAKQNLEKIKQLSPPHK